MCPSNPAGATYKGPDQVGCSLRPIWLGPRWGLFQQSQHQYETGNPNFCAYEVASKIQNSKKQTVDKEDLFTSGILNWKQAIIASSDTTKEKIKCRCAKPLLAPSGYQLSRKSCL